MKKRILSIILIVISLFTIILPVSSYAKTDISKPEYYGTYITVNGRDAWGFFRDEYHYKTWTGKAMSPKVTVYQEFKKLVNGRWNIERKYLVEGKDYVKSFSDNKGIGHCRINIKGKGKYRNTNLVDLASSSYLDTLSDDRYLEIEKRGFAPGPIFVIRPLGTKMVKTKGLKKAAKISWKCQSKKMTGKRISGYQIQYSKYCDFYNDGLGSIKNVTIKGYKNTSTTIKKLKSKRTYYVRVRTYYQCKDGFKAYSTWSEGKSVRTK